MMKSRSVFVKYSDGYILSVAEETLPYYLDDPSVIEIYIDGKSYKPEEIFMTIPMRSTIFTANGDIKPAHELEIGDIIIGSNYSYKVLTDVYIDWDTFYNVFLDTGDKLYLGESSRIYTKDGFKRLLDCEKVLYYGPPHYYFNRLYSKPDIFEVYIDKIKKCRRGLGVRIFPDVYYKGLIIRG